MIVNYALLQELFRGFHIQRWNDRIRPMELIEMDKHAHKMVIAWCLAKYEEEKGREIDWIALINGGIYELLRRIIISDIKSPIFREIKKHKEVFDKLNAFIFEEIRPKIADPVILSEIKSHFLSVSRDTLSMEILEAAHIYSSYWEFKIVRYANPGNYQNIKIETALLNDINGFSGLEGIIKLINMHTIANFVDLCGQLRFQVRWAQMPRLPKTSVLGHSLFVAIISYFFAKENKACPKRLYNAFFGGLFHDLPEAATRDIVSPIKQSSVELERLLKDLERQLAENEIFPLVEPHWASELKYFIQEEFHNKIVIEGAIRTGDISTEIINRQYNSDIFNSYDGVLIRAADHLAAFLESWNSCNSGIKTTELIQASEKVRILYKDCSIGNVNLKALYDSFPEL